MTDDLPEMTDTQKFLVGAIRRYVAESPLNRLSRIDGSPIWEEPLVGFADGDDPLFLRFKQVVGEDHLTPREVLARAAAAREGGVDQPFARVGVVSWVLPVARETRRSNRDMSAGPSLRWNHTRFQGEELNEALRWQVVSWLEESGHVAVAPVVSPFFATGRSALGIASNWSERHVAHAAGLGAFGLSDGLITARGIAHRLGSAVANAAWAATPRPYADHHAYCSFYLDGSCGTCIDRCPAGAITRAGHDKDKCREYLNVGLAAWAGAPGYLGTYSACGLCQCYVPCEMRIPARSGAA